MRLTLRPARAVGIAALAILSILGSAFPVFAAAHPSSNPTDITRLGSRVYFAATTAAHGRELWTSDGTPNGTSELKDINPSGDSDPSDLTVVGNRLFFNAYDGSNSSLWVTDGTPTGTVALSEGYANELVDVSGTLFFLRHSTVWMSNGTIAGTDPIETVPDVDAVGIGYDGWRSAAAYKGNYYFFVDLDEIRNEPWWLWRSDGTPAGTEAVDSLAAQREPTEMVVSGDLLYFNLLSGGGGGINPGDLWKSDGTPSGTRQVKDLYPAPDPQDPIDADGVGDLTNVGGTLYFSVHNGEVWRTNGTEAGTKRLEVVDEGNRMVLARLDSKLMFSGSNGGELELWRSKGTQATTRRIHAAGPYSCSESAAPHPGCNRDVNYTPASAGGLLFFPSDEGTTGIELWASDGTTAGTFLVKNIRKGPGGSNPSDLAAFGVRMLLVANDAQHGRELWISDGTTGGTKLLKDINPG